MPAAKRSVETKKPRQVELALTYSVGDWVWAKSAGHNKRVILARIESAQPMTSALGDAWLVRCYYSPQKRKARGGWSATLEHRHVTRALNAAEVAGLRNQGVIPVAGGIEALS